MTDTDASLWVTGQLADKPTHGQSTRGLVNSPKCLILKLEYIIALSVISARLYTIYTLPIFHRVRVRVRVRLNVQIKYSNSMFFFKFVVGELSCKLSLSVRSFVS